MAEHISIDQMAKLYNIMGGNIPLAAVRQDIRGWYGFQKRVLTRAADMAVQNYQKDYKAKLAADYMSRAKYDGSKGFVSESRDVSGGAGVIDELREMKEISEYSALATNYFDAIERGDYATAQSLSAMNSRLRKHWNSRSQTLQQTSMVKHMLGKDKSTAYMTQDERVKFYHKFIENARDEQTKAYNEYLMYMYMYGCVIHAILNSMLHARGVSLDESQYRVFLKALYDEADTFFNSSDFKNSFALTVNDEGKERINIGSGTKHITPKTTNMEAAKHIRNILHNKLGIDMSNVYISDKEITDGYALTAEAGTNLNKHKVAQDVVTKALLDSLEGRRTQAAEGEERLWIGTTVGGGQ